MRQKETNNEKKKCEKKTHQRVPIRMTDNQNGCQFGDRGVFTFVKHLLTPLNNGVRGLDDAEAGDSNRIVQGFCKGVRLADFQGAEGFVDESLVDEIRSISGNKTSLQDPQVIFLQGLMSFPVTEGADLIGKGLVTVSPVAGDCDI